MAWSPDILGNSGMRRNLKGGQNRPEGLFCRKLLQIQLGRLPQVAYRFFNRCSLAGGSNLGALGNIELIFFMDNGRKGLHVRLPEKKSSRGHICLFGLGITKQAVNDLEDRFLVLAVEPLNVSQPGQH